MNPNSHLNPRAALSAVLAALIVGTSGLALDKGHTIGAPAGVIVVGELTPIDVLPQVASLPEITVTAPRLVAADGLAERV